ncbi:MAG: VCBS repeat-containing protein [Saprospiraceae bacterium]|nr:VCBS repeat-containing protein [Saprospiraceae bacterium]
MKWLTSIVLCFLLISSEIIAQDLQEVAKLTGTFLVSDAGSATYSIPITLPPGTGGMKPELGLNYSSNGSNGILGLGWSFSGLSVISRGAKTISQDEVKEGVRFTRDDVFYLDGERLVLWNDAFEYGDDGAEYGTESNTFVKVVSRGISGEGPGYFEVYTKTGLVLTFGSTDDSRVYVPGTNTVLYYLLNRMEENRINGSSNFITYEYDKDENNASYRPSRIRYTQNTNVAPGLLSLTDVLFVYEDRNDIESGYVYGIRSSITQRLHQIQILQKGILQEVYDFTYQETGPGRTSLLNLIQQCMADGTCSDPIFFDWNTGSSDLSFTQKNTPIPASAILGDKKEVYTQDINNDGLTDIFIADRAGPSNTVVIEMYLNVGNADFAKINSNLTSAVENTNFNFVDVNSDGYVDVVATNKNGTILWYINPKDIAVGGSNLFQSAANPVPVGEFINTNLTKDYFFLDFNGDSRLDFLIVDKSTGDHYLYQNGSDSLNLFYLVKNTSPLGVFYPAFLKDYIIVPVDLDNDGKTDLLSYTRDDKDGTVKLYQSDFDENGASIYKLLPYGIEQKWFNVYPETYQNTGVGQGSNYANNGFSYKINNNNNLNENVLTPKFSGVRNPNFVDLNGDGLLDMVISRTHNHWYNANNVDIRYIQVEKVYSFINRGNFQFEDAVIISSPISSININIVDPKCPLTQCGTSSCFLGFFNAYLKYNSGTGWFTRYTNPPNSYPTGTIQWEHPKYFIDLDSDGKSDLLVRYDEKDILINTKIYKQELLCNDMISYFSYSKDFRLSFGRFNRYGTDMFLYNVKDGSNVIRLNDISGPPPVITKFSGQLGGTIEVEYSTLNDPAVYTKGSGRSYPDIDFSSSGTVVSKYNVRSNASIIVSNRYAYSDGVLNLTGRGFRGFKKIEILDEIKGFRIVKEFEEDSRFIAANLKTSRTYSNNNILLSEEIYKNVQWVTQSDGSVEYPVIYEIQVQNKMFTPFPHETILRTYDLDGNLLVENRSKLYMDAFGNTIYQVFIHGDGCIDSIYNEYQNDWENWHLGRLLVSTVFKKCPGSQEVVRESAFEYHPNTGLLVKEILEPNQNERTRTTKTYEHDMFGNITKTSESAWNGTQMVTRTKTAKYDPAGRFQTESINEEGHRVITKNDPYRGLPIEQTDENGLITKMIYNSLGILRQIQHPDGTTSDVNSNRTAYWVDNNIYTYLSFSTSGTAAPLSETSLDVSGRELSSSNTLFDGRTSWVNMDYNAENRLSNVYHPYRTDHFEYDAAGRVKQLTKSGNELTTLEYLYSYAGLSEMVRNPLQQVMTKVKDVRQRLLTSLDNDGNQLQYIYDTEGQLKQITAGEDEYIIRYEYDLRGRIISMEDPVLGREEYTYDGFSNLLSFKDGKGNVTAYTYDNLNRLITVTREEGVVTYTYDQGNKAIGKLISISSPGYSSTLTYDNLGRLSENLLSIDSKTYSYKFYYNSIGKLDRLEHPSGIILKYHYNDQFYLDKITNNQNSKLLWELKQVDDENRAIEELFGNGVITSYAYDVQDNLSKVKAEKNGSVITDLQYEYNSINLKTKKTDLKNGIIETYTYDNLNRLTNVTTSGQVNEELNMTYDKWGNITSKSDLGIFHYNAEIPTLLDRIDLYNADCNVPSSHFTYSYTSFNKISKIEGDSLRLEVAYGPDNQRLTQKLYVHDQLVESRVYVGNDFEVLKISNKETKRLSIPGSMGTAIVYESSPQGSQYSYLHKDGLGSVIAITNDAGITQIAYQYDVWGKRTVVYQVAGSMASTYRGFTSHEHIAFLDLVNMNGRIYDPVIGRFLSPDPHIQDRTYFQNVNRFSYVFNNPVNLVDPSGYFSFKKTFGGIANSAMKTIGRIGSGITQISKGNIRDGFKSFGQAYIDVVIKWYGWREVDRHGKDVFGEETWNQIVVASATIVVAYTTGGFGTGAAVSLGTAITSGAAAGAAGGALSSHLAGAGTNDLLKSAFKGAVIGGISAGLTHGIGTGIESSGLSGEVLGEGLRAIGHGAVQGTMNELQGGKFSQGFYSGFVSSIGSHTQGLYGQNPAGRVFAASVVGGTISSVTGGKFATGAVTGAFVEMFNNMSHNRYQGYDDQDELFTAFERDVKEVWFGSDGAAENVIDSQGEKGAWYKGPKHIFDAGSSTVDYFGDYLEKSIDNLKQNIKGN